MIVPAVSADSRRQPDSAGTRRSLSLAWLLRLLAVALGGLGVYAASPPRPLWWLVPLAVALFAAVVRGRSARAGFGYGVVFGAAYLLPLMGWLWDFLGSDFGPWPWLGVVALESLFFGLAGACMARASRLALAPVWMAAVFLAAEMLRSSFPFGGLPWGRLAFTQGEGVFLALASVGGTGLVTFAVTLTGTALAELGWRLRERDGALVPAALVPTALVVVPIVAGLGLLPTISATPESGTAKIGLVQGNAPNVGLDLLYQDDVLHDNHIRAAYQLAEDVRADRVSRPDLVVLPEQVGVWGPTRSDPDLDRIATAVGAPLAVGGLLQDQDGKLYNKVLFWQPGKGATQEYTKQHPVAFSETIPMRPVARLVTPFVDRFRQDMVPGERPGVFNAGRLRLGVGICFDVAYDDVFTGAVREGANLLAVPTNNAWFGRSEMSHQQLAMSRLRAVEHGRAVVVAATSGISAVVMPDGTIERQTEQFTAQNVVADVPLRSSQTLATRFGDVVSWVLALLGIAAVGRTLWRNAGSAR